MSLAFSAELVTIPSPCVTPPTDLTPGRRYRVASLTQGAITYDIISTALDATALSEEVEVRVSGAPGTRDGWRGVFDFADCQLIYLQNNFNNEVWGKVNIGVFPWLSSSYSGNRVGIAATLTPDAAGTGIVRNNELLGTGTLNLSAAPATISITGNLITGTVTVSGPAMNTITNNNIAGTLTVGAAAGNVTVSNNLIAVAASISLQASNTHSILRNSFLSSSVLTTVAGASGSGLTVQDSSFENGTVTFDVAVYRPTFINTSRVASGGSIVFSSGALWNNTGNTTISTSTVLSQGVITMNGGSVADFSITVSNAFVTNAGNLVVESGTNNVSRVAIEGGTLSTAGFNVSQSRLEGASSTLIADASLSQKSGYVGVLP